MTLLPLIVDKAAHFCRNLDALAARGKEFELGHYTARFSFDVIGEPKSCAMYMQDMCICLKYCGEPPGAKQC